MDGAAIWKKCPEQFDKILVDGPCSSESRISTLDSQSYACWNEKKIQEMTKTFFNFQTVLGLRPWGELVYSTCSFAPEENVVAIHKLF